MPDGLTVEDFAKRIREKMPDYEGVDDYDLTHRVLKKHPEYKDAVSFGPRDRAYAAAARSGISRDLADDFLNVTGGIESGNRHRNSVGVVLQSPPDPKTGERAVGFSQIKPSTIKPYGLDPYDEDQNIEGGLRYFSEGGEDPVARRIYYFGGPGALKRYQKTGRIPKGQDVTGTTFDKYVKVTMPKASPTGESARFSPSSEEPKQATYGVKPLQSNEVPAPALDTSARRPRSIEDDPTKEPVGYMAEIRKQSPDFEAKFYDFLQSNTPPTSKAKTVGQAAGDQSMAWSFLKIADFAQKNKGADADTINKGLSQIGVEFLRNPQTSGAQLPRALHDAMLAARYTPEEWEVIPEKLRQQVRQYRAQVAVQRGREKAVKQLQQDVQTLGPTVNDWLPDLDYHLRMDVGEFQSLTKAQQRKVVNLVAQRVRDDQLRRQAGQVITAPSVEEEIEMRKSIGLPRRPITPLTIGQVDTGGDLLGRNNPYHNQPKFALPDEELRSQARQQVLAERKARTRGPMTQARASLALADQAVPLEQEVEDRVAEMKRGEEERDRLLASFTPQEKQTVVDLTQQLVGHGTGVKRGIDIGVQGVTSSFIYKLAGAADAVLAGGPNTWVADWLRKQALTGEMSIEEVRKLPSNKRQDVAEFVTSVAASLPEAVGATALAGPVAGFASLGASEAQGRKLGAGEVIRQGAKGALIGKVFDWSDLIAVSSAPPSVAETMKKLGKKATAIGTGTAAVELGSGAEPKEAVKAALTNALLPVVMAPLHGRAKGSKNAIQERGAKTSDVGEAPQGSAEMGARASGAGTEQPSLPQGRQSRNASADRAAIVAPTKVEAAPTKEAQALPRVEKVAPQPVPAKALPEKLQESPQIITETITKVPPAAPSDKGVSAAGPEAAQKPVATGAASPSERRGVERDPTAEMMSEERRQQVREMIANAATPEDAIEMRRLFAASKAELKPEVSRETSPTGDASAPKPLPELRDNFRKPLKEYADILYRETSANGALDVLPTTRRSVDMRGDFYLSNTPDLALGQGKNKGILLEFEPRDIQGQVNRSKPAWKPLYEQGQAEFIARHGFQKQYQGALTAVTVKPDVKMSKVERIQLNRAFAEMEQAGWTKTSGPKGVTYRRPVATETPRPAKKSPTGDTLITGERSDITLSQFVRKRGGIVPAEMYKGELDRLRQRETGTTGLINQNARQGNLKQTADIMMEAANEAGFRDKNGQPFTNPGDFLRAVERDVAGEKTQAGTGAEPDWDAEIRKYEVGQQDLVNDADARVNLLENETSGVIYDKIAEGKASEAELQQFREQARAAGLSSRGTEDLIASASADRGEATVTAPSEAAKPAQQLGFVEEGLTQESAPPPKRPDRAQVEPPQTQAFAKLAELKRRGLTIDDYARQPDLEGNLPSAKEVEMLRAAERPKAEAFEGSEQLNFGPGTMRAGEPLPEVKERKFGKRFVEDERIAQDIRDSIGTAKYYEPISEKVTIKDATRLINERGLPQALKDVRDESNALPFRVRVAMGEEAVLKLNQTYKRLKEAKSPEAEFVLDQATDTSEFLMDYGTRLGQGVQAFAMWAKLTPEGKLLTYKRLVDKARQKSGNAEEVKEIIETVNKEMSDAERIAELDKLFKRNKTAQKVKSDFDKLIEAAKDGKLTDQLFYDIVGDRLGLPKYDKATAQKIMDLALEIEAAPEGMPRDAKIFELNKFIAQQKGFDPSDLPIGIYYGNILSGYNTHIVNAVDTAFNVISEVNGLAINNPRAAAKIYGGMLRGFVDGRLDSLLALTQGRMVTDGKWLEVPRLMELAKFGKKGGVPIKTDTRVGRATKAVAESKVAYPLNAYKYVTRLLAASDAVFFRTAKEARASLLAYRMAEAEGLKGDLFGARVQQILAMDREADFTAQAKREGFTGVEAQVRAKELRDLVRDKDLTSDAAEFAGEATYNHKPHGVLGYFSDVMGKASEKVKPLKLFVPFTRIVANVTNRGLNYTPWGLKRAFFGYAGEGPLTPEARRLMITRSVLGMVGINTLAALQAADYLQIHGNGPSDKEKRRQLQQAGWRPYSIQIGDAYISYLNSPIGLGLSITGNMSDSARYHELEQKDAATRGAYAVARLGSTIFSQSFLSGLSRLFGALSEEPSRSVTAVKQVLGSTVAAATTPNLARDIHRLFDNTAYQSNTLMEDLIRSTPFAGLALKPQLNAFGEPVKLQRQRFFDILTSDPAWRFVTEKGLRVPVPSKTTELADGERISPDEYYDLLSKTGPRLKQWITENTGKLGEMKEQDAQEEISKASTAITKDELDKIRKTKGMKRERVITPPSTMTNPVPDKRRSMRPRRSREWMYPSERRDERQRRYNVQPQ